MGLNTFGSEHNAWHSCGQHACLNSNLRVLPTKRAYQPTSMASTDEAPLSLEWGFLKRRTPCLSGQHTLPALQVYKGNWRHTDVAVKRFLEQDLSPQLMKVGAMLCQSRRLPKSGCSLGSCLSL